MTDITELAQREKFEAWFVNDVAGADVTFPAFEDGAYAVGEIYDEQLYFMLQAMWMAWKAAGAELVEALEKAQCANAAQDDHINQQQDRIDQLEKGHQEAAKQINSWRRMAKQNIAEREKDIAELDAARQRIAELESRTVKLPKLKMLEDYLAEVAIEERKQILVGVKLDFHRACVAAGIKVGAE
ncbi:hypothetical protein MXU14_00490 [Klebsiella pneumoniae]|uniref:hypothetical protein n=1 Tax=Klebsiella pneumoniae TaxID=573 RepID=UPI000C7DC066|nr:hypothetical protein [Klebsiella pneumoniae]ELX8458764.1 hypothetical protein [Klebsiella pneumoniae]MDG0471525.1 hypothetical protein [Klebsiella pneumoniae]MDM8059348.1 hypothetical protein [Klebsiella pneumoniae]MDM8098179.1 hypothetical protein [Klebsiella pneumoniae]MDP1302498.1 hypothetical protein [Klebsiella pneumoniae]